MLVNYEVLRFNGLRGGLEALKDVVAVEDMINLYINGKLYTVLHCTPSQIRELVIGRLLTDGIISKLDDILEFNFYENDAHVRLSEERLQSVLDKPAIIAAICAGSMPPHTLGAPRRMRPLHVQFGVGAILKAVEALNFRSAIFRASGGTHAAALVDEGGEVVAFAEDVGRHNAADKVIGEAATKGLDFDNLILASTGRLTSEMVIKAALIMVPVMVSLSAPTSMGIKIAEAFGLTLIGFARLGRFNIYTAPDRIRLSESSSLGSGAK